MSHFDGLLNDSLPLLQVDWDIEGEGAGIELPPNVGEGFELIGHLTQPQSKIHSTYVWITPDDEKRLWTLEHEHDYDEILVWTGSDPDNPRDLGAEVFMTIDGEEKIITESGSIYIPAGTRHCPLGFNKVWKPFTFSAISLNPTYQSKYPDGSKHAYKD